MTGRPKQKPEGTFYRDLGRAIRAARVAAGKTQTEVAEHIGVTFQQLQKYENGGNRIPVEHLVSLAEYVEVPVPHLLALPGRGDKFVAMSEKVSAKGFHAMFEAWSAIEDKPLRAALLNVVKRAAALSR